MANLDIICRLKEPPDWLGNYETFVLRVLEFEKKGNWELSLTLCYDSYIQELNRQYRNKDEATDVLTFCQDEGDSFFVPEGQEYFSAGDIVISIDSLMKNAAYFAVEAEEELKRLSIHGILHLSGMTHETNDSSEAMLQYQEKIVKHFRSFRIGL